jgi:iron complex outermembrane receptor protein
MGRELSGAAAKTAICLLLLAVLAKADQADQASGGHLKRLSLEQLGNIEVTTASKEPVKVLRTAAAIYVITQEDIRRSGATSIPEVLRLAPGVTVARIDASKWSIGIRGFGSRSTRSVLVVIDGRNVYSPLNAGVYWEVQDTLMEDVDRIEIIRGPGATIWGPNAVNGVINIITRKAKDTQGALVSSGGGNEQSFLNFRYGAGNGKNLHYRGYGKVFNRGPEFHSDGKNFDDWRAGQGGFRADWEPGSRDTVTVQGDVYKGALGESISVTPEQTAPSAIVQQDSQLSGGNLLGRWRRVLGDGSDLQVQTYYDRTNRHAANFAEMRDTFDVDFLHHLTLKRRQQLLWGAGARFSLGRIPPVVPTLLFIPQNRTDKLYSAFVQDEVQIAENLLSLTLGSKFLRDDFSGFNAQPSARLLWTPSPRQTVWAAITHAVRTPADVEVAFEASGPVSPNPLTILRLKGNPRFAPETLLGYEGGYRALLGPKLYVDVTGFHNRYDDLLSVEYGAPVRETSPSPPHLVLPLVLGNGLYGSTSGFEIAPDWRPAPWWRLAGSYAYLYMDLSRRPDSTDTSTVNSTLGASPHHKAVIESFLDLPGKLEFSQAYRYVSALPAQRVGSYQTVDVRLGWRPAPHIEFSVVGQNLLQPHHTEFGGDPGVLVGIKRSVYAAITWRQ